MSKMYKSFFLHMLLLGKPVKHEEWFPRVFWGQLIHNAFPVVGVHANETRDYGTQHSPVNHPMETCYNSVVDKPQLRYQSISLVSYTVTELSSSISAQAHIVVPNFFVFLPWQPICLVPSDVIFLHGNPNCIGELALFGLFENKLISFNRILKKEEWRWFSNFTLKFQIGGS